MESQPDTQEARVIEQVQKQIQEPRVPQQLRLRYWPDPVLSQPCLPVTEITEGLRNLAADMIYTMMKNNGIGLAAPQVGERLRMFVADVEWQGNPRKGNPYVFINPAIVPLGANEIDSVEGCLSFPGTGTTMKRSDTVIVRATGMDGQVFELTATGLMARVVQHENDHLNGVTIHPKLGRMARNELRKGLLAVRR